MATKIIGYVVEITGSAQVRTAEGVIRVLSIGDTINDRDLLITGNASNVVIAFYNGHNYHVSESSTVFLDETVYGAQESVYSDEQVDQIEALQQAILEGGDVSELEATAAGNNQSSSDGLHEAPLYERDGREGKVDTRPTGFLTDTNNFDQPFIGNDDNLGSATNATATIFVNAITADDIVNVAETGSNIDVTGSVGGVATSGDTVSFTINGTDYTGIVAADNSYTISVAGSDLATDTSFDVTVNGIDSESKPYSASVTSAHTVDITATASITVDPITEDDVVNAVEAAGNINVTGSVGGDATPGDTVSFSVNGNTYSGLVTSDNTFTISVSGSDLVSDTSFDATTAGTDSAGNFFSVTTTSSHTIDTSASASIVLDAIAADDYISITEFVNDLVVTGSVSGDAKNGDVVVVTIGGVDYSTTVNVDNVTYSVTVPASAASTLIDGSATATVSGIDTSGNSFNASIDRAYTVEINNAPVAVNDSASVTEDTVLSSTIDLDANDSDIDGHAISVVAGTFATAQGGSITIAADGSYSYTPASNFNGEDSVDYTVTDGHLNDVGTLTISVTPVNDAATVSNAADVLTETNAVLSTGGVLTSIDVDNVDNAFIAATIVGATGTFTIDAAGTWGFTANSTYDNLNVGDNVNETFNVTSIDGTMSSVDIIINGTNDAATVNSSSVALLETNAALSTSGALTSTDVDNADNSFAPATIVGTTGTFTVNVAGAWSFTANSAYDNLDAGSNINEIFNVTSVDGTASSISITINGTNDVATLSSATTALTEDDTVLSTGGILVVNDADTTDATVVAQTNTTGTYGVFNVDAVGVWTYVTNDAVNQLDASQVVTETFTVSTTDGGSNTVTVNITGSEDVSTLTSATEALTETNTILSTGGILTVADADTTDAMVVAQMATAGTYGTFAIDAVGVWTYVSNDAVNQLDASQVVTETFTVSTTDGGSNTVTVNITGSEDVSTLTSETAALTETDAVLSTGGTLTVTDADTTDATVVTQTNTTGTYGTFSIDAAGAWTYVTNDAVNQLDASQVVTETFTVSTTDGGSNTVSVNITGSEDVSTLSSVIEALTETDAILSTGGSLVVTDADTTDATVVAQTNTTGTYGVFNVDAAGVWTYVTNDAVNQLDASQVVTETFTVSTTDGGSNTVTVNITGSEDVSTLTSATEALTETNTILSTGGILTVADADTTDATVVAQAATAGTYGTFAIDAAGVWTYVTNDAVNQLDASQVVTEIFTVNTSDGDSNTVTVNITGNEDVSTLTSATTPLTETDAVLSTAGTLIVSDADTTDATVVAQVATTGTYGTFSIDAAGVWTYVTNDAVNQLDVSQVVTETFTVVTSDGGSNTVTVNITGSEDVSTLTSATQALTETDAVLSTGGTLTVTDPDTTDATVVAQTNTAGTYGVFNVDAAGVWTYITNDAVNQLDASQVVTETFTVATSDGGSNTVTVNITGSEDVSTLTSDTAAITETNAVLSTGGTLTVTDPDTTDATVVAQTNTAGTYGVFNVDAAGVWTYITNDAVNQLDASQVVTEIFTVATSDGSSNTVTVNITGSGDVSTLTSATEALTETNVTLSTGGTLTVADADTTDATVVAQVATAGSYGTFAIDAVGVWTYVTNDAVNQLDASQVVTETFTVSTTDGGSNTVTVNITGSEDVSTLTSETAALTETDAVLSTGGTLTVTDADATDATVVAQTNTAGTYGVFNVDAAGVWTYVTNDAVNQLDASQVVTETFTVSTTDGGSNTVSVNITGSEDVSTLSSTTEALTETDAILSTGGSLVVTDADTTDATVVAQAVTAGTYGTFAIDAAGVWTYVTNDAVNQLDASQVVTETFTVNTSDGGSNTVTVNITGSEDVSTLTSDTAALTETNAVLSTGGTLTITDVDTTDATVDAQTNTAGTYGVFNVDAAGVWTYVTNDAVNQLDASQVVTETFIVATSDGGNNTVTVNITGSEDVSTLTSATASLTETNAVLSTGGSLTVTDADATDATVVAQTNTAGTYGVFNVDAAGVWTYVTNDAVNQLDASQVVTETFTVATSDGGSNTVTVNITGSEDVSTLTSATEALTETNAVLSTGGTLTVTDADTTDATVVAQTNTAGAYGVFNVDAAGVWSYVTNDAVNQLDASQLVTETFTVSTTDGGSNTVTVNITGSDDTPVIAGTVTGTVIEDGAPSVSGALTISDVDTSDTPSFADVVPTVGDNGYGSFVLTAGAWTYTLNNANATVHALNTGDSLTDTITYTATDGSTSTVTINISGSTDGSNAIISGFDTGSVTEDNSVVIGNISDSNVLTISDPDVGEASFTAATIAGTYGSLTINAAGSWAYTASNAQAEIQALGAAESLTDTISISSVDGAVHNVVITINGTNDVATLTSATSTLTENNAVLSTGGTIILTDIDTTSATIIAQTNTAGTYGVFNVDAAGVWTYVTNDAVNQLDASQVVTETFTVSTTDGGSNTVTVNITGSEDVSTLTSDTAALTETNAVLSTGGTLTVTDADATDATVVAQAATAGTYGTFAIDAAGVWTYVTNDAVNQLDASQVVTETFTVNTSDGGSNTVTVNITGSEDVSTLTSATQALTETDAVLSTGGILTVTDADTTDATVVAQTNAAGTYGVFNVDAAGVWTYVTNDAVNQLDASQVVTETFTVSTTDGGSNAVTVNITGSEDVSTLTSDTAAITETNAVLSTGGTLVVSDADTTDATVVAQTNTAGTYGVFNVDATGVWTYVTNDAVNQLDASQVVTETFTVSTTDGGSNTVTVNITGSEDVSTLTSATQALTETDAVLSTGGILTVTDADTTDATVVAQTNTAGTYGVFNVDAAGVWTYVTNDAVNQLDASQVVTETFTVSTTDGGSNTVTVNITGSEDVSTLTSATENLTETNAVLSTGGTLVVTDADTTDATVVAQTNTAGTYGVFNVDAAGVWSYVTNDAVNQLDDAQAVTETFTVATSDGSSNTVTVNITGSEDVSTLTSATASLTETNAVLSTGGTLTVTDADATDATVVTQTNTAGTYGVFNVDAAGVWTYVTNDAVNQLDASQVVTETFTVATSDGGSNTVTVNIAGSEDVSTLTSATENLTETNAVLSTGGTLVVSDADTTDATVVAQTNTAGTYGVFNVDAAGVWTYVTNDAVNQLDDAQAVTETFTVATSDGGSNTVTVNITGSEDVSIINSATTSLTETNAVLSTGGTLTVTDADTTDATVVAQTNTAGTYGVFNVDATGVWTYVTNDAVNQLDASQVVTETFTVATSDGDSNTVTVNITGSEDVSTLTSATASLTETNAVLSTGGTLTVTDADTTDAMVVAQAATAGTYGTFAIDAAGAWTYVTNDAVNQLDDSQVVTETFTVNTSDGGSNTVTVNITGSEDVSTLSSDTAALTETDAVLSTGGTLTVTDADATDATVVAQAATAGTYGTFAIDAAGVWTYVTNDAVNQLDASQVVTETFTVATSDGGSNTVTVNITGSEDVSTLTSATASLTETNAVLSTGGTLTVTDADTTDATVVAQTNTAGTYGVFNVDAAGVWTYITNDAVNQLDASQVVTETFTVSTTDGGSNSVTVNITGSEDVSTLTSDTAAIAETNAVLSTGGTLVVSDADTTDATVVAQAATAGTYGTFAIDAAGAWIYVTNDAVNQLDASQVVTETFTVNTSDGSSNTVTVNITGSEDVSTLTSDTAALTETNAVLSTGGTLTITDVDTTDATVDAQTNTAGTYGVFNVDAAGVWTYVTNDAVNQLDASQVATETFTVSTTDGGSNIVTVNITGSEDVSTITSATVALTETNAVLSTGGTLTVTDADTTDASVIAQSATAGAYGTFAIDAAGVWIYVTNDSVNQLNASQVVTEMFTVSTTDGGSNTVTVNITGSEDVSTLTSDTAALTETNAVLSTGGTLTVTDADATDATVVAQAATAGTYGTFAIDAAGVWTYVTNDAVNQLDASQVVTETFTVNTSDGGSNTVTVNITGSEDVSTLTSATQALTETDAVLSTGGILTVTDADTTDATVVAQTNAAGTYGVFNVDAAGVWTYVTNDAVNQLDASQVVTETFTVSTTDGGSNAVTVNITGSEDVSTLTSDTAAITETNAVLSTGGTLVVSDADTTDATVVAQTNTAGTYGVFNVDATGVWTYVTNDAVNQLDASQVVTETFTVSTTDGGSNTVTVNITGSEDVSTLTSATQALTETDAVLSTGGILTVTDADTTDATVVAQTNTAGTYGVFNVDAAGVWTYVTNDAVNQLDASQVVTETFTVSTTDGGSNTVTVNITGSEDVSTLTSATQALTETDAVLSTGGTLTVTDTDTTDATVVAQTNTAGTYGAFSIDAAGVWTYVTNDAVNQLDASQVVTETFTVSTTDGGSNTVTVNITGSEDVSTLTSATEALTETNAILSTGGTLTVTDADTTDATVVAQTNTAGTYGVFNVDAAGVWTYVTNDAVNQLDDAQAVTETFTVATSDGGSNTVTVNITGSEDVSTLTSATASLTETNAVLSTGGTLTVTDADTTDATVVAQTNTAGTYGTFAIDAVGVWTYVTNDAVNQLDASQVVTEAFTVSTTDGSSNTVTVNITGSEDVSTLTSDAATLTETNAVLSTGGTLMVTDADATNASVVAQAATAGTYGTFAIDAVGVWTYVTNDAVNQLDASQIVTETFTVNTTDGGSNTVTVNITGSEDVSTLTSDTAVLTETNAVLSTGGTLTVTDADTTDATVVAQTNTAGTYGVFNVDAVGVWTYVTNDAVNQLDDAQAVTETFTVATSDGGSTTVTVNITGSEDVSTLSSSVASLTETNSVLSTGGILTVADADATDATVVAQTNTAGSYGVFNVDAAGVWTYVTNDAVNQLDASQVVTETFTVATSDGDSNTVTVNITGSEDVSTLTSATASLTETNAVLSTGGTLTVTDPDATDATVVTQTNTAGTYGVFNVDAAGVWTYVTNDAVNQLDASQVVTETFTVATSDGGSNTVTVNITGSEDVSTLTSATENLTETNAVLSTGGTLTVTDADTTDATVVAQTNTAGTYGIFNVDAAGVWTYVTNDAVNQLDASQVVTETFIVATSDGGSNTVTVNITGSEDVSTLTSATASLTETNAVLSTGGSLTVTDADATDATVVAQAATAGIYGTFAIDTAGVWTYVTNDAVNQLDSSQVVTETFTVSTTDGGSNTVTVNITGSEDVSTLTSDTAAITETNAVLSTGGTLVVSDADATDATVVTQTNTAGTYGVFNVDAAGVWTYVTNDAVNQLDASQVVTETFIVATSDGGSNTVTVNITGSEDVSTLTSATQALTETDAVLSTGGTLTVTDTDTTDATVVAQTNTAGTYGVFNVDAAGVWTYVTNDAVNQLDASQVVTETFTVNTSDGGSNTVTVNITGSEDVSTLTSATEILTETDAVLSTGGTLTVTDADATDAMVVAQAATAGTYGTFTIDAAGVWAYVTNDAVNQLDASQVVTETFTVSTTDGGSNTVTVNITGSEDVSTLTSATEALTETNAILSTGGTLTVSDLDTTDATVVAQTNVVGINGTFNLAVDGTWTYVANSAFDNLNVGDSVSESFTVASTDGATSNVTVTINGTNDAAVVSSANVTLSETDAALSTGGTLTSTDPDNVDNSFIAQTNVVGTNGTFNLAADGTWTFVANSAFDNLDVGDSVSESFSVSSADGTTSSVTVTINGTIDAPMIDLDADNSTATGDDYSTTFTEGGAAVSIADVDISITSLVSSQLQSATLTITDFEAGDLLNVGGLPAGISASAYDPVTGELTLSGAASLADYQTAIRAIQFTNDGSSSANTRNVEVTVTDGESSNVAVTTININMLPTVAITDVSVQEPAAGTTTLVFTISLDQTLAGDLTFDYSTADISALAGADYVGISATTGTIIAGATSTTVTVTVNSDTNNFEGDETFSIDLSNFNQTVNFASGSHITADGVQGLGTIGANNGAPDAIDDSYITQQGTPLVINSLLNNDSLVDGAVITGFTQGANGTIVDNGDGSYTYSPTNPAFSGTDTFTYTLTDADGETDTATVTVSVNNAPVNPPVVTSVPDTAYTENDVATPLLSGVSISDVDSTNLGSIVVRINGYISGQDSLTYLTAGTSVNASVSVTGNVWQLTLTGGVDINEYQSVLGTLQYENTSDNPSSATRTIAVEAYDETYNNLFGTDAGSLTITPQNDAADVFDNNNFSPASAQDNALNITPPTDVDNDDAVLVITIKSLPTSVGVVTLANGTPVNVDDVLSLEELSSLQFDAGATDGTDILTYTVFDGALTTVGTTTINVGSSEADVSTVYESALSGGTDESSGLNVATGNLFSNDASADGSTTLDSIDFSATNYTPDASGIITIVTNLGTLTVYADNTNPGNSAGDYTYTLDTNDGTSADVSESFTYNFTSGSPQTDTLTIDIIDDLPIANNLVETIPESEEQVFNIVFTLDDSGSMAWGAVTGSTTPPPTEATRMDIAQQSLSGLATEYFNQSTQVTVTLITFNSAASFVGTYTDFASFEAALNAVTPGGGTNYVDATDEIQAQFTTDLATQNPADDVQNVSYFISDGAANAGTSPIGSTYLDFVNNNSIDSYGVGIGSGLPADLSDLNYIHNIDSIGVGHGHVDDALIVEDVSQLEAELLSTVPTAFGGNIVANGSIQNLSFGADGGFVQSIEIDLGSPATTYTFSFDGSAITASPALPTIEIVGSRMTLNNDDGFSLGTFTFDFSDGSYSFIAPNGSAPNTVNFDYTIVDGDGDTAAATATIDIVDDSPDARDDLHSVNAYEAAEGNVITAIGTDGGPSFGGDFTPFATQGGGVDKVVDNAVLTEFSYKGSNISLDLTLVTPPAPTGTSDNVAIDNGTNFATTDITLSSVGGVGFDINGAGVIGGRSDGTLDDQDGGAPLTITFDAVDLPYGVDNLVIGMNDYQSNNNDAVTLTLYDVSGGVIATVNHSAASGASIDLSSYSGIGSVDLAYSGSGFDAQLSNIAYDPAPAVSSLSTTGGTNGSNLTWVYDHETDLDGNDVFQATVTDSNDGSTFIIRSNGYYNFTPDQSGAPVDVSVDTTSQANVNDSDLSIAIRAGGATLEYSVDGVGIAGGNGQLLSTGEALIVTFDGVALPNGVNNLILTLNDFQSANTDQATVIVTHDTDGDGTLTTDTIVFSATNAGSETLDLSQFSGVTQFDIEYTGGGWDLGLGNVTYQPPVVGGASNLDPVLVDYTLTDTDGQSDTARLSIYTIDQTISGTIGADNIMGGVLNDAITGDTGDDILSGGDGHDTVSGGAGSDILSGNAGNDYLSGGADNDSLFGGADNDYLDGDAGDDLVDGGTGDDIVTGGDGDDLIFGGAGNDMLEGEAGNDQLIGGAGIDNLFGGTGVDILNGGVGDDELTGGSDIDTFVWSNGDEGTIITPASDVVTDFTMGVGGDVLNLADMLQGESTGNLTDYLHFQADGSGGTLINVDADGGATHEMSQQITLTGVDLTLGGTLTDQQILDSLLTNGNLIVD